MSAMSELSIDIEELLATGMSVADVAKTLDIPVEWVETAHTYMNGDIEGDFDDVPF